MIEEVDPAVGGNQSSGQAGQDCEGLPGESVGLSEQSEEDEVDRAEPHELTVTARHSKLFKLD